MTHLVSFATSDMSISARVLQASAHRQGINQQLIWGRAALEQTLFYEENKELLDQTRGSGYWAWKSWVILDALYKIKGGDILIYSDAGIEWLQHPDHIIKQMHQDIFLFGNKFQHTHWCKADTWVPLLSNQAYSYTGRQAQASVLFIRATDYSIDFVKRWLDYCLIPGMIDDTPSKLPNHSEFQEHRHDQAILTCLAIRDNIKLHWWPAMYNAGAFQYDKTGYSDNYPVLFHHHRRRNHEWSLTDPLNNHITDYFKRKYSFI